MSCRLLLLWPAYPTLALVVLETLLFLKLVLEVLLLVDDVKNAAIESDGVHILFVARQALAGILLLQLKGP